MKANQLQLTLVAAALFSGYAIAQEPSAQLPPCEEVVKTLQAEIAAEPSRVLLAVENALTVNSSCACEIIRAAIVATKADSEMVGEIVFAAVNAAPAEAAKIVECAAAEAPKATPAIRNAMQKAMGENGEPQPVTDETARPSGKEPVGKMPVGKEPVGKQVVGKEPAPPPPAEKPEFGEVGPVGIYIIPPVGGRTYSPPPKVVPEPPEEEKPRRPHRPRPPGAVSPG